jgi:tetratricopeptide (TPR) repeat protein
MNGEFSRARRFTMALCALAGAALLFRSQVADALVLRGDDYLYRGEPARALQRYARALALDPFSQSAVDRYVFVSIERSDFSGAVAVATRYLSSRPNDGTVRTDRALCYLHERRYALAERDFESAARATGSAPTFVFAGWAARHAGNLKAARALWMQALRIRPGYRPATLALAEHAE